VKKSIIFVLLILLLACSTGCTILNDSQSSIENDDKLIIDETSAKNTSEVLIQALETKDAELFKSVFSEQALKLQPDIDEGVEYILMHMREITKRRFIVINLLNHFLTYRQNVYGRFVL
jgi:hypothetical protein